MPVDAPYALTSFPVINSPCPVLLPATIKSPKSIGSREGMSSEGIPVTR